MKKIYSIFLFLIICCSTRTVLHAQDIPIIDISNAEGKQGDMVTVMVAVSFANLLPVTTSTMELRLSYPPNRLLFEKVTGGTAPGGCAAPTVVEEVVASNNGNFAFFTVSCNDVKQSNDNITFTVQFRVLGGQDISALIEPRTLILNGDTLPNVQKSDGVIKFDRSDPLVFPTFPEGLGQNFPNPFNVETKVFYSVEDPTNVRFKIFNAMGKLVFTEDIGTQQRGPNSYTISPLSPTMQWTDWEQSSGLYSIVMETDNGVYRKTFMYLK